MGGFKTLLKTDKFIIQGPQKFYLTKPINKISCHRGNGQAFAAELLRRERAAPV